MEKYEIVLNMKRNRHRLAGKLRIKSSLLIAGISGLLVIVFLALWIGVAYGIKGKLNKKYLNEKFTEWVMKDWPKEDISTELPLDKHIHTDLQQLFDEIQQSTERLVKLNSWPNAEIPIHSISYIARDSNQYIGVSYSSRSDINVLSPEVVFGNLEFEIHDGRLRLRPVYYRQVSPFADVMIPILRKQTQSIIESATFERPISWPLSDNAHETILNEANHFLDLYLSSLKTYLEDSDKLTGQINDIKYIFRFKEGKADHAAIRVGFGIMGTPCRSLNPELELDYKEGKFRLKNLIGSGWPGDFEYVGDASYSAMDYAVEKWVKTFNSNNMFEDARIKIPFEWKEIKRDFPNGMGRIVQIRRRCHPFLTEYNRKYRIELIDGRTRTFRLPTDDTSIKKTDVFLIQANGKQFIRLKDDRSTDIVIAIDSFKIRSPSGLSQGKLLFTFKE